MADNTRLNPGEGGDLIATDECTVDGEEVKVPRGKLGFGGDGDYTDVSPDDPLPVRAKFAESLPEGENYIGNVGVDLGDRVELWVQPSFPFTVLVNSDNTAPTLKNLANNANKLGNGFDNRLELLTYADFELLCRGQTAFTAGGVVLVWLLQAFDGDAYEDGSDSVTPARAPDLVFPVRAVDTQQRIVERNVLIPPTEFRALVRNATGQAFTNTDGENLLRMSAYTTREA